jgi:chromosome segregation ATPase
MSWSLEGLERAAAETAARIGDLKERNRHLARARDEEDHQARRDRDALERHGGRAPTVESRVALLDEGRKMTARVLRATGRELTALERRLAEIEAEIARRRGDTG